MSSTMESNIKIRYNTLSDGHTDLWRVIVDNVEYLTNSIIINVPSFTSKDEVFDLLRGETVVKYHISCKSSNVLITKEVIKID